MQAGRQIKGIKQNETQGIPALLIRALLFPHTRGKNNTKNPKIKQRGQVVALARDFFDHFSICQPNCVKQSQGWVRREMLAAG